MSVPKEKKVSIEDFYKIRSQTHQLLEYIDGFVFMTPSPSTLHQRVSGRLYAKLFNFLEDGECEVFSAPYDIHLYKDDIDETKIFIPDLSVICDKTGFKENGYQGVPSLIIEILSPSNQNHDLITKMDAYMRYGVKEYWIVNPMIQAVQLYTLNQDGIYEQADVLKEAGMIKSYVLNGFELNIEDIFKI